MFSSGSERCNHRCGLNFMHDNKTVFMPGEGVREGLLRNPTDAKIRRRGSRAGDFTEPRK